MTASLKKLKGSHALRHRCPLCGHLRRFAEPPDDVNPGHPRAGREAKWVKIENRWVCVYCALRILQASLPL